jgi:hypothetical protein
VDLFKDFYSSGVNKRHRKPIIGGTDLQKKHLNIVPAKYKSDNTKNRKIELLKKQPGKFTCDNTDLAYITRVFLHGRMPPKTELKVLGGKMNIQFYFDTNQNKWVIEKR